MGTGLAVFRDCSSGPNLRPRAQSAPRTSQLGSISSTKICMKSKLDTAGRSEMSSLCRFLGEEKGEAHIRGGRVERERVCVCVCNHLQLSNYIKFTADYRYLRLLLLCNSVNIIAFSLKHTEELGDLSYSQSPCGCSSVCTHMHNLGLSCRQSYGRAHCAPPSFPCPCLWGPEVSPEVVEASEAPLGDSGAASQ